MKFGQLTASVITVAVLLSIAPAFGQYNPATPVGPPPILPPTPSVAVPHMNPQPPPVANDSRSDPLASVPSISLGAPSRETHNDRSIRCVNQGLALGVPSGSIGQYTRDCVNSP
jgi:hypothetical protein